MFSRILAGAALAACMSAAATAADLPVVEPAPVAVPSFTWSGLYVGAQAGYGWGKSRASVPLLGNERFKPKGGVFGAFLGYNVQLDNSPLVLGVETDFNYADVDDSKTLLSVPGVLSVSAKDRTKWTGATRGRVGVAFDRVLVYGAAGVAYARRTASVTLSTPLGGGLSASIRDRKTAVGWTVGGGVEYAVTDAILVRGEYRYTDFGKDRFDFGPISVRSSSKEHRVMAGAAFKFSSW